MRTMSGLMVAATVAAACAGGGEPGGPTGDDPAAATTAGDVSFTADTRVLESFPVQLRTEVVATNRGSAAAQLTFPDGCVVLLRAYREGETTPVWDQRSDTMCTASLVEETLAPGAAKKWEARTDVEALEPMPHCASASAESPPQRLTTGSCPASTCRSPPSCPP
jgi:hypothetical protein